MVVGNHQCNAANLNQSKPQFQLELSLAQFSPSLFNPILLQITLQEKVKKTYYQKDNLYQIGDIDIQTNNGLQAM